MNPALADLLDRIDADEPFDYEIGALLPQQLQAADARFQAASRQIGILARRGEEAGISGIRSRQDLVPLLFSHTTYKSYPESLVDHRRWSLLARWVDSLAVDGQASEVDFSGVGDLDGFIDRLQESGHPVFVSSGTTGKCSLFSQTAEDLETTRRIRVGAMRWATSARPDGSRPVFILVPSGGRHRMVLTFRYLAEAFGRPDATYWLTERSVSVAELNRRGALRQQLATGSARPQDFEVLGSAGDRPRATDDDMARDDMARMAEAVLRHADEPAMVLGLWAQHHALAEELGRQGFSGFHPDSMALVAGGLKGATLPGDFRERVHAVYGLPPSRWQENYGMVEGLSQMTACGDGAYHVPPWVVLVVLDPSGERLATPDGERLEGRMAYVDLALGGRWGGVISGDRVVVHLGGCPCGRPGPTVREVARYSELAAQDDKLTCAGTVNAYLRGSIGS